MKSEVYFNNPIKKNDLSCKSFGLRLIMANKTFYTHDIVLFERNHRKQFSLKKMAYKISAKNKNKKNESNVIQRI